MIKRKRTNKTRRQKKEIFNLRVRMILTVQVELVICLGLSFLVNWIANGVLRWSVPLWIEFVVVSMIVGTGITVIVSKIFFDPIKKLRKAIEKVTDGDFSVKLDSEKGAPREIREIYSGFNIMTEELKATEILQSDFVSNVSHEIKTPIGAIEGYATLLQDWESLSCDERKSYIDKIMYNTGRLSSLVGNILLLSKIDNQSIQSKQSLFRLDEQIRQAIMLLEPDWVKKDIEFDVDMDEISITDSESLLHHVWYNLIGNAVKFSPHGGTVTVKLTKEEDHIVFSVTDNGPGIEESAKKHIFDKFYQADSSHKGEGNGLGLSLVKQILNLSDSEIEAENVEGGCKFTVMLKRKN